MKVCIIGAGDVGSFLAQKLAKEDMLIGVIDTDPIKLESLSLKTNILTLNCDASQEDCINNCKDYDFYLVLTDNDELNLATALFIRENWKKKNVIVRIHKPIYNLLCEKLNLQYINVVESTVSNLNALLEYPFAGGVWQIGDILIWSIKLQQSNPLTGKLLKDFSPLREKFNFSVVLIRRNGNFLIPKGSTRLLEGDEIYLAGDKEHARELLETLGIKFERVKTVFVLGYSRYADFWFKTLEDKSVTVKFFHPLEEVCQEVGSKYPFIEVYQAFPTDRETLKAEGLLEADYVWCLDENDEKNIVTAMFVKNLSAKRVGVLLKHPQYENFISSSGIDAYVLPKKVTASKIYSLLKGEDILEVIELAEGVDIFEKTFEGGRLPLRKLKLEENEFVLFLKRNSKVLIPKGDTVIENGDRLLILRKI